MNDFARDIAYALRSFRRAPLAALTIVATVALGLGLVTAVFAIYDLVLLRVDAVQRPAELFAVSIERLTGAVNERDVAFTRRDYDAMRRETSVFADAFASVPHAAPLEGRLARSAFVTGNFFQMLGVQAALGRALLPYDDQRADGRPVIVLSHSGWRKLFQEDRTVIGRRAMINGLPFEIIGVAPAAFRGLEITPPDFWAPLSFVRPERADEMPVEVVGRLKPGTSRAAAASALVAWASGRSEFHTVPGRPIQVRLASRQGTLPTDDAGTHLAFVPLFFAFGLILLIGCANVANLLLARAVSRQREIGIRLSLGASRLRIIRQLLTESFLLAIAAAAGALFISRWFLGSALSAVMTTVPPEFVQFFSMLNLAPPAADWRMLAFLVFGAIASTALFGLAPALQGTRLDVVRAMRGEMLRDARPRRARQTLIAAQVGASALLMICAAVFLRGAFATAGADPGVRASDTLRVSIETEDQRTGILQAVGSHPLVTMVGASSLEKWGVLESSAPAGRQYIQQMAVSPEYFAVLGLDIVAGRGFTPSERSADSGVVVVPQSLARQLWPEGGGVGQVVRLAALPPRSPGEPSPPARALTVVGVVRDPARTSGMSFGGVYLPTGPEIPGTRLWLRVRGNPEQVRLALLERLTGLDPAFGILTLRSTTGLQAYLLQIAFGLAIVLGGLALALTVSGLFSVLSYLVEQQAKEIGVRMALGAVTSDVVRFVLSQSLRPFGIGLIGGSGLAAGLAIVLLATPASADIGAWINVSDPAAYIGSAAVITAACLLAVSVPALRAARIDPIATLRNE